MDSCKVLCGSKRSYAFFGAYDFGYAHFFILRRGRGLTMIIGILGAFFIIVINLIGAALMARACAEKGYDSEAHVMAACFWLGIFGYLYAICLPDKVIHKQNEILRKELTEYRYQTAGYNQQMPNNVQRVRSDDLPDL